MADLSDLQAAQTVKLAGTNTSGVEQYYINADSEGSIQARLYDRTASGTITALNGAVSTLTGGCGSVSVVITGTWVATLSFQATVDGSNWITASAMSYGGTLYQQTQTNGTFVFPCAGYVQVRVTATEFTSGTVSVQFNAGAGTNIVRSHQFTLGQHYPMFTVATDVVMASASTDNPLILLRNPSGSGKIVWLKLVIGGCSVVNVLAVFRIFANPTVSANGTTYTVPNLRVGDSSYSPVSLVTTVPTVTNSGTQIANASLGQNSNSVILTEDMDLSVAPNNSILITGAPGSNNRNAVLRMKFMEVLA